MNEAYATDMPSQLPPIIQTIFDTWACSSGVFWAVRAKAIIKNRAEPAGF
jgi:hypothetical protein